jgi:hypothetical protein
MTTRNGRWWLTQDSAQIVVSATASQVYDLVADLPRMGEWSPECAAVEWEDAHAGPVVGARFVGHSRTGPRKLIRWSRRGRVLVVDPGHEFAFATGEGGRERRLALPLRAGRRRYPRHRVLRGDMASRLGSSSMSHQLARRPAAQYASHGHRNGSPAMIIV